MGLFTKKTTVDLSHYQLVDYRQLEGFRQHPGGPAYENWSAMHIVSMSNATQDSSSSGQQSRPPTYRTNPSGYSQQSGSGMTASPTRETSSPSNKNLQALQKKTSAKSSQQSEYADDLRSRLGLGIAEPDTKQKRESIKKWLKGCGR